jgi:hypothetical protein
MIIFVEVGDKIEWNQMVGAIFKIDGIHYQRFELGKIPDSDGKLIEAFIGSSQKEIGEYATGREHELNSSSPEYLEHKRLQNLEKKEERIKPVKKRSRPIPKKDLLKFYEHISNLRR